jgi:hypothetical protein
MSLASYRAAPPRDADDSGTHRRVEVTLFAFPINLEKVASVSEKPATLRGNSLKHIDFRQAVAFDLSPLSDNRRHCFE